MNRRDFLKGLLGGAAVVAATPYVPQVSYFFQKPRIHSIGDDFTVSLEGDIRYVGNGGERYTVLEMHQWLHDAWTELGHLTDPPSKGWTDNVIALSPGYSIEHEATYYLNEGTLIDGDKLYSSKVSYGY